MKGLNPSFITPGEQWGEIALIPLTSGSQRASVVAVRRDESFQGRDKGPAFGRGGHCAIVAEFQHNELAEDLTQLAWLSSG